MSLLGHYKLNDNAGNTIVTDSSGNGRNGVSNINTSSLTITGKVNEAFSFSTSDYIDLGTDSIWNFGTSNFSVSLWFKIGSVATERVLIAKRDWSLATEDGYAIALLSGGNTVRVHYNDDQDYSVPSIDDDQWHHLIVNFDYSNANSQVFLDGSLIDIKSHTQDNQSNGNNLWIARNQLDNVHFDGEVDDLRIYDNKLSGTEVALIYNNGSGTEEQIQEGDGIDEFTVLMLHADGTDGSTSIVDDSPSSHSPTVIGNAHIETDQSKFGGSSLEFDGSGDGVDVPHNTDFVFGTKPWTMDFWIRFKSRGVNECMIAPYDDGDSNRCRFAIDDSDSSTIEFGATSIAGFQTPSSVITNGQWYHIAIVRSGAKEFIFIDGVKQNLTYSTDPDENTNYPDVNTPLRIGYQIFGWYLDAYMDEIRISKNVARWVEDFTPPTQPYSLVVDQDLNENVNLNDQNEFQITFNQEDSLTISDEVSARRQKSVEALETLNINEDLSFEILLSEDELINLSDDFSQVLNKEDSDSMSVTDEANVSLAKSTNESENITIEDNSEFQVNLDLQEAINISDEVIPDPIGTEFLDISDGISINDEASVIQGEVPIHNVSKILHNNPLYLVTDTDPMQLIEVTITDPQNPIWTQYIINGTAETVKNAKDLTIDTKNNLIYVACADGQILELEITDLNNRQQIDTGDTDDLEHIDWHDDTMSIFSGTSENTGEIIVMDSETIETLNTDLRLLEKITKIGQMGIDLIHARKINTDLRTIVTVSAIVNTDLRFTFGAFEEVAHNVINRPDFDVKIDGTSVDDLKLDSIVIRHDIDTESNVTFTLARKHDELNYQLDGTFSEITNQNLVEIYIDGNKEFEGNISELNTNSENETVQITAIGECPATSRKNIKLPMTSLNERLHPYQVLLHSPRIYNPVIDPNEENPKKFLGIKIDLGTQVTQKVLRYSTIADTPVGSTNIIGSNSNGFYNGFTLNIGNVSLGGASLGRTAFAITEGTFQPRQNWTYFWGPVVAENFLTGNTSTGFYVGTSLSGYTSDVWELLQVRYKYQRILEDAETGVVSLDDPSPGFVQVSDLEDIEPNSEITKKTEYFVGSAPYREISTRNGRLIPAQKWVDRPNGLYEETDSGYDYLEYAKKIADLEYDKIKNINGSILPETSADIELMLDGYYYYRVGLLNRLNIENTTTEDIYNGNNGFPVAVKGITISSINMRVTLNCDNTLSQEEIEEIEAKFPDPLDFQTESKSIFVEGKYDPARDEDVE